MSIQRSHSHRQTKLARHRTRKMPFPTYLLVTLVLPRKEEGSAKVVIGRFFVGLRHSSELQA